MVSKEMAQDGVGFYLENGSVYMESELPLQESLNALENVFEESIELDEENYLLQSGRPTTARLLDESEEEYSEESNEEYSEEIE